MLPVEFPTNSQEVDVHDNYSKPIVGRKTGTNLRRIIAITIRYRAMSAHRKHNTLANEHNMILHALYWKRH